MLPLTLAVEIAVVIPAFRGIPTPEVAMPEVESRTGEDVKGVVTGIWDEEVYEEEEEDEEDAGLGIGRGMVLVRIGPDGEGEGAGPD